MTSREPWRCKWCMRLNKMNALRCGGCDHLWHRCIDQTYVHEGRKKKETDWSYPTWSDHGGTRSSSRKSSASSRKAVAPKNRRKTKKNKNQNTYGAPELDPPWSSRYRENQPEVPEAPKEEKTGKAEQHLQELITRLKNSERELSPETKRIVEESTEKPVTSKQVHTAVKKLDQARSKFKNALKARKNLHMSWTGYIEESITRWTKFAEEFTQKDKELEDRVKAATEKLQEAKDHLDEMKEKHTKQDEEVLQDAETISDDNMDEESMKAETAETIKSGIVTMLEGLDKVRLRSTTPEDADEGNASKKPRVDAESSESVKPGSRMLQPFAKADK